MNCDNGREGAVTFPLPADLFTRDFFRVWVRLWLIMDARGAIQEQDQATCLRLRVVNR